MEDLFRSAFENASLEPPHKEKMWGLIADAIQKPPVPIYRATWFRVSSIAASVTLLMGIFYYLNDKQGATRNIHEAEKSLATENVKKTEKKKNEVISTFPKTTIEENTTQKVESNLAEDNLAFNSKNKKTEKEDNLHQSIKKESIGDNSKPPVHEEKVVSQEDKISTVTTSNTEENVGERIVFEVKEIFVLTPEIVFPQVFLPQPTIALVVVSKVEVAPEKVRIENPYWVGFGGFYNTYKPNFQFDSPDLPSPFVTDLVEGRSRFPQNINVASAMRDSITINPAFSINIDFGKLIAKSIFVRSGINFSSVRYSINSTVVEKSANVSLARVILTPNTVESMTTSLNIPVQIGYQSAHKRFNYFASAGFSADMLLNNSLTNTYAPAIYNFGRYKTLNVSALGSAGFLYNLTPQFAALVEMNYRLSLTSVYDSPHLVSRPQWVGFGFGLRKKF